MRIGVLQPSRPQACASLRQPPQLISLRSFQCSSIARTQLPLNAAVQTAVRSPAAPALPTKVQALGTGLGELRGHLPLSHPAARQGSGHGALLITALRKPAAQVKRRGGATKKEEQVPQRLSKVLAAAGVASRRAAEELIFSGDVKLNGKVVTLPQTLANPLQDTIEVKGKPITSQPQRKFYFAVNKPKGYACTSAAGEGEGGRLVAELLQPWLARFRREHPRGTLPPRLFTVGRLDVPSVGLLFMTNDGQWAQQVMHPSAGLTKEYIATVDQPASRRQLELVAAGCEVDGVLVQPVAVAIDNSDPANNGRKVRIIVAEGRNREVRQLLGNVGLDVTFLKRVRIGGYKLPKDLALGATRPLKPNEVRRVLDRGAQSL